MISSNGYGLFINGAPGYSSPSSRLATDNTITGNRFARIFQTPALPGAPLEAGHRGSRPVPGSGRAQIRLEITSGFEEGEVTCFLPVLWSLADDRDRLRAMGSERPDRQHEHKSQGGDGLRSESEVEAAVGKDRGKPLSAQVRGAAGIQGIHGRILRT